MIKSAVLLYVAVLLLLAAGIALWTTLWRYTNRKLDELWPEDSEKHL